MDPLLEERLGETSPPNSYDVTVTSFLNQFQQTFVILLEILSCIFIANLSKIELFMFSWQHLKQRLCKMGPSNSVITSM